MKIFTHTLVLFDNGFCWKWKTRKQDDNSWVITGTDIALIVCLLYIFAN